MSCQHYIENRQFLFIRQCANLIIRDFEPLENNDASSRACIICVTDGQVEMVRMETEVNSIMAPHAASS